MIEVMTRTPCTDCEGTCKKCKNGYIEKWITLGELLARPPDITVNTDVIISERLRV